ncbi:MAG: hypothetical protein PHW69_09825 [Elusimicrobiaceae bacterium]|nr:hypothetical protein [Elusimicrobiaceae bacterium]
MTSGLKRNLAFTWLAAFFCAAAAQAQPASLEGLPVTAINITETRVSSATILSRIPLKPGEPWSAEMQAKTRRELHRMGIFRTLEVSERYDETAGGVAVDIKATDGWYILPIPLFTSGNSGSKFSLTVLSGNFFRRSETVILSGSIGRDTAALGGGLKLGDYFIGAGAGRDNDSESFYSDGAYNTFSARLKPEKFGEPVNTYNRKKEHWSLSVNRELDTRMQFGLSFSQAQYSFSDATAYPPAQSGLYNTVGARCAYTLERGGGLSRSAGSFGAIFGLGLSDLNERITPRAETGSAHTFEIRGQRAGGFTGSTNDFSLLQIAVHNSWEFIEHDRLSVNLAAAKGWTLPFTQLIPTGPAIGLAGQYSREWRGEQGAGATASFTHLLSRSKRGQLVAEPFFSQAWVWNKDTRYPQTGAGLNFYYKFWRFPLPLGIGVTYSLQDCDITTSFSAGMGFGKDRTR